MSNIDIIATDAAPKAIGPYSQATAVGNLVFTAGQIALDPVTMEVVSGEVGPQARQVFANLAAVLKAAGTDFSRVVKTTVFLADMAEFGVVNEIYAEHFGSHRPARSTVQAAGLPKGVRVEIECIALR
ncbi:MAG: RidA family protein [Gemmatimonadales bacterium]|mgnify:CR=1 FL=1|nr:RidA family protein [Gemmatimonadales bacterium]